MRPSINSSASHEELDAFLGEGDHGRLYTGRWHGEQVAIKLLKRNVTSSELKAIRRRIPPVCTVCTGGTHLVRVHDVGRYGAHAYLVMEPMVGGSLEAKIGRLERGAAWPWRERLGVLRDVAAGMHHLHTSLRFVHLGLRPASVLLDGAGRAKVGDYGHALPYRDFLAQPIGMMNFSSWQAAPEILAQSATTNGGDRDPARRPGAPEAADAFAFGHLMHWVLTRGGEPPPAADLGAVSTAAANAPN